MPLIRLTQLQRGHLHVCAELDQLGLWSPRLEQVEVRLTPASLRCYGWQNYGTDGAICIPAVSGQRLWDAWQRQRMPLRQVLRHEWAHALAYHHPQLVLCRRFEQAFDGPHELDEPVREYSPHCHISTYAASQPMEDFAEVFMEFVKHRGVLPGRWRTAPIERRWRFVAGLADRLRRD